MKRMMIAAPKSGSGKTTVTLALLQILKNKGYRTVSYKCGPDYIDPMFHQTVLGVPSRNLDTFFTGEEQTREIFLNSMEEGEFAVLEGVMGLFDGLGGILEEGSSYHLAKVTETPILLVVDAKGMGRSVLSVIAGFLDYDKEGLIQGVLLNRTTKGCYDRIKPLIEEECKIKAAGFLPEKEELRFESRHLGLLLPREQSGIKKRLRAVSEEFQKTVSIDCILGIAEDAGEMTAREKTAAEKHKAHRRPEIMAGGKPVIAAARDEAFCFYYADNLRLLQEFGAKLHFFLLCGIKNCRINAMHCCLEADIRNCMRGNSAQTKRCAGLSGMRKKTGCLWLRNAAGLCICIPF